MKMRLELWNALERATVRLVRVPLIVAAAIAVLLVLDAIGLPGALFAARIGVKVLLGTYLLAGVLNLPSFPRALRQSGARIATDHLLLDAWTVIALLVGAAVAVDGSIAGLI